MRSLLRRFPHGEHWAVLAGLVGAVAVAWAYLLQMARDMDGMALDMLMPRMQHWDALQLFMLIIMWAVMMVGMMLPTALPMTLLFVTVNRRRRELEQRATSTIVFVLGYVLVWSAFSVVAASLQWGLHRAALLSPQMAATSGLLGGSLLVAAGVYQWTPLKSVCLSKCRTPLAFLLTEWREGSRGALVMGLRHGAFCTGCCWVLMALLFVGGVMNLLWVAAIAAFVLAEKIAPRRWHLARLAGLGLMAWGGWLLLGAIR